MTIEDYTIILRNLFLTKHRRCGLRMKNQLFNALKLQTINQNFSYKLFTFLQSETRDEKHTI